MRYSAIVLFALVAVVAAADNTTNTTANATNGSNTSTTSATTFNAAGSSLVLSSMVAGLMTVAAYAQ